MVSCTKLNRVPKRAAHEAAVRGNVLAGIPLGSMQVYSLAGNANPGSVDSTLTWASFSSPNGVAVDGLGNIYVADKNNHRIRKVTQGGVVTTLAGSGQPDSTNGHGTLASFKFPTGVAVDATGNVYVADSGNHEIRRISPSGDVITLSGSRQGYTEPGPAAAALFNGPNGVAVDGAGNVYVSDAGNYRVRKIRTDGFVDLMAGSGNPGFSDQRGDLAAFDQMAGLAVNASGSFVYVADAGNHRIRRITAIGDVSTLAGQDNAGNMDGGPGVASFIFPAGVAVDPSGIIYVTDKGNGSNRIRQITPAGVVSPFAGNGIVAFLDGVPGVAEFKFPAGLATDATGNVYVADQGNHRIREIGITAMVTTLAGNLIGGGRTGGAQLTSPDGIVMGPSGSVYVSNGRARQVLQISLSTGFATVMVGSGGIGYQDGPGATAMFKWPVGLAIDAAGIIYVADEPDNRIRKITPAPAPTLGIVGTVAGNGVEGYANGPALTVAEFDTPDHVAVDAAGNVYVSDGYNNRIRKVTPAGNVISLAGGTEGAWHDGRGDSARFNWPGGVAVDPVGNVYVSDYLNNRIRKITPAGDVTTIAGTGEAGSRNGPAGSAQFDGPDGIALDAAGYLYITELGNNNDIRVISPGGIVSTLAGGPQGYLNGVGRFAKFSVPVELAVDPAGAVYVVEEGNHTVRKIQ